MTRDGADLTAPRPSKDPLRRTAGTTDPDADVMLKGTPAGAATPEHIESPADVVRVLGPGLITGASDLDPSAIGTYSQVGSQFGYGLLWTGLFTFPLVAAVQEMCGRIALQTGVGLGAAMRRKAPGWAVGILVFALVVANTINVGADLGAISAGIELLSRGHLQRVWLVAPVGLLILLSVSLLMYEHIVRVLKWLTLVLFAYVVTAVLSHPHALDVVRATFVPHVELSSAFIGGLVAVFGTTLSPYAFFWQASSQVDMQRERGARRTRARAGVSWSLLRRARLDILAGIVVFNLVVFAILLTTGTVLHAHGAGTIQSAEQAAAALAPLAGSFAFVLFALGIIGTGLLAVPVMLGSAVYALREFFGFGGTLALKPRYRPTFYLVLGLATLAGVAMNYVGVNPIQALLLAAAINGVLAPLLLALITAVAADRTIMRDKVSGRLSLTLCILTTAITFSAAIAYLVLTLRG